uniref:Retinoblastoma-like protein 1 n=2 Tax=Clastoptera arizonana TaxID=38151 RepID=A0A1B6EEJ0_9HEMI
MVFSDEDDDIFKKFNNLCNDLNMDKEAANEAWQTFDGIRQNCTLEGDKLHWLGCALYVACRNSAIPTVGGKAGTLVEGNLVSLTRLLRLCNFNLIQFFNKIKKWADMASLTLDFREKIGRLERNFAVSMVIFKKFQPIFHDMFAEIPNDNFKTTKSKKQRNIPCSPQRVFDFAWTLFICIKADFPDISDDLVNSYHLLLACCDLIFANAVLADRRDLLNPSFRGLPMGFGNKDYLPPSVPPCVIYHLCESHDGILVEAKGIKEYCFKNHLKKLFDKKILRGDPDDFSGLIDICNFEANVRSINKSYEEYVLSVGEFDERIFLEKVKIKESQEENQEYPSHSSKDSPDRPVLRARNYRGDEANSDIGTPTKIIGQTGIGDFTEKLQEKRNLNQQVGALTQLVPPTPLTGRKYLKSKEPSNITPVSTATQSVSRLQSMLNGRKATPSPVLLEIISSCSKNPQIEDLIKEMGEQFCLKYTQAADAQLETHIDFAKKRLQLAECLYYKLLENILVDEKKKPNFDYNALLHQEIFHQTLFACCLEIIIYSYNSQRTFPWILEALGIYPYHFYKVIEIIVRTEDQLSRDMVKHLNLIEENILESLAWRSESPLWAALTSSGLPVPSCEDVALPGQVMTNEDNSNSQESSGLVSNSVVRKLNLPVVQNSPAPTASERFQSPVPSGFIKKKLFTEHGVGVTRTVKPGQSLLNTSQLSGPSKTVPLSISTVETEDGKRYIPITISPDSGSVIIKTSSHNSASSPFASQNLTSLLNPSTVQTNNERTTAKRTGSLALFFRKFYHLASVRMHELCTQLELTETELRKKIWTCFEHSIVEHNDLMLDRHLDQILMCAVYVICKIVGPEKPFTEVMRCYRMQPQSSSNVYRSVLLKSRHKPENAPVSPVVNEIVIESRNVSTGSITSTPADYEDRCDIIKFYNTVYVQKLQNFARRFTGRCPQNENITLSPLLVNQTHTKSPRKRISERHPVYIRVLDSTDPKVFPPSPTKPLSYCFSRSPAKDLLAINKMIQIGSMVNRKRLLNDDDKEGDLESGISPPKQSTGAAVTRRVQDLFVERLVAKSQD